MAQTPRVQLHPQVKRLFPVGRIAQNILVGALVVALFGFMAVLGLRMDLTRAG